MKNNQSQSKTIHNKTEHGKSSCGIYRCHGDLCTHQKAMAPNLPKKPIPPQYAPATQSDKYKAALESARQTNIGSNVEEFDSAKHDLSEYEQTEVENELDYIEEYHGISGIVKDGVYYAEKA
jgi:hypothetical protein